MHDGIYLRVCIIYAQTRHNLVLISFEVRIMNKLIHALHACITYNLLILIYTYCIINAFTVMILFIIYSILHNYYANNI